MALTGLVAWMGKRELSRIELKEGEQDDRLGKIEEQVSGEESDIKLIRQELTAHILRDDEDSLVTRRVELAVARIEANMPNGDMKVAIAKLDTVARDVSNLGDEVRTHNRESETWKQEIVGHRVRIAKLEEGGGR